MGKCFFHRLVIRVRGFEIVVRDLEIVVRGSETNERSADILEDA